MSFYEKYTDLARANKAVVLALDDASVFLFASESQREYGGGIGPPFHFTFLLPNAEDWREVCTCPSFRGRGDCSHIRAMDSVLLDGTLRAVEGGEQMNTAWFDLLSKSVKWLTADVQSGAATSTIERDCDSIIMAVQGIKAAYSEPTTAKAVPLPKRQSRRTGPGRPSSGDADQVRNIVVDTLATEGAPMRSSDLLHAAQAKGFLEDGSGYGKLNNYLQTLINRGQVVRLDRGVYGLSEWENGEKESPFEHEQHAQVG